jgi:hypothetical protein
MSWAGILPIAERIDRMFKAALRDQRATQTDLLRGILAENRETEFGRANQFATIDSIDDYRRAVPLMSADSFVPWIERIAAGQPGILTRAPVMAFERTSGTAAGGRLIPYTAASLVAFRHAVLPWLADLARRRPGITRGRLYASISPATRPTMRTASGIPIGLDSDAAYLGEDLVAPFLDLLAVSPLVGRLEDVDAWRIATLAQLVEAVDLSFVSAWSPTFLVELVQAIPANHDAIASQIGPEARRRLAEATRTGELETARLWPMLDCISCWTDGASARFARILATQFPGVAIDPKGLLATEAAMTLPYGGGVGAVTALMSNVVEYIDPSGEAHLCDTLEPGVTYRVAVTTPGGLYRYAIGDVVTCTSVEQGIARLRFEGRDGVTSDLVGEKLDDAFVSSVLDGIDLSCALVPDESPPRYVLCIDAGLDDAALCSIAARVDAALRANPHYDYARNLRQLGAVVACSRPGFMLDVTRWKMAAGARLGDVKPVGLLLRGEVQ